MTNQDLWCIIYKSVDESDQNDRLLAAMAQVVEHILGKDEVAGSNPVNSLKVLRSFGGLFMFRKSAQISGPYRQYETRERLRVSPFSVIRF